MLGVYTLHTFFYHTNETRTLKQFTNNLRLENNIFEIVTLDKGLPISTTSLSFSETKCDYFFKLIKIASTTKSK